MIIQRFSDLNLNGRFRRDTSAPLRRFGDVYGSQMHIEMTVKTLANAYVSESSRSRPSADLLNEKYLPSQVVGAQDLYSC